MATNGLRAAYERELQWVAEILALHKYADIFMGMHKSMSVINICMATNTMTNVHISQCMCSQKGPHCICLCGQSDIRGELYNSLCYCFSMFFSGELTFLSQGWGKKKEEIIGLLQLLKSTFPCNPFAAKMILKGLK